MMTARAEAAPEVDAGAGPAATGRALWQLPADCHGPLVGCCWTAAGLRRLTDKLFGGRSSFTDFELHVAVAEHCAGRNKVSLALQRDLQRRFADERRRFGAAHDADALRRLWSQALADGQAAAALWATLSHAKCDEALRIGVLQDLYLLQHEQVALQPQEAAARDALRAQLAALKADALRAEERQACWRSDALAERERLQAELAVLRGRLQAQDAQIARLRERPPSAEPPAGRCQPGKPQADPIVPQADAVMSPPRRATSSTATPEAPCWPPAAPACIALADATVPSPRPPQTAQPLRPPQPPPLAADALRATSVLCVGGRHGHVPQYRELVERHGGRFAHHDGGIEDNAQRLDAQLAAADVVLCQSGCLNHNAYARVKAHCKRSGKPCVYLDKPGVGSFLRGLAQVPAAGVR